MEANDVSIGDTACEAISHMLLVDTLSCRARSGTGERGNADN